MRARERPGASRPHSVGSSRLCKSQFANLSRVHGFAWSRHVMTRHVMSRRVAACLLVSRFRAVMLCRAVSCLIACPSSGDVASHAFTVGSSFRTLSCPPFAPDYAMSSHLIFSSRSLSSVLASSLLPSALSSSYLLSPLSSLSHPILGGILPEISGKAWAFGGHGFPGISQKTDLHPSAFKKDLCQSS